MKHFMNYAILLFMSIMAVKAYRRDQSTPKQSPKYHEEHENKYRRTGDRNYGPETQEKDHYPRNVEMDQNPKQGPHSHHRGNNRQNYPSDDARANSPRTFIGGEYPLDTQSSVEDPPLKYSHQKERNLESYQEDYHTLQPQSSVMKSTPRGKTLAGNKDQNNAQYSHNSETGSSKGYNAPVSYYNSDMRYAETDYRDGQHSTHGDPNVASKRPESYSHSPKAYPEEFPQNGNPDRYHLKGREPKYSSKPHPAGSKTNGREGSGQYYEPQQESYHGPQYEDSSVQVEDRRPFSRPVSKNSNQQTENTNYRDAPTQDPSHKSRDIDPRQRLHQVPKTNQYYSQQDPSTPQRYPSGHNRPAAESTSSNTQKPEHQERAENPMRVVETKKDMQPLPSEAGSNLSEEHDGFLDMGAYTDKKGSFGWYADFPVGKEHDKVTYSFS